MQDSNSRREADRIREEATRWFVVLHETPADPSPRADFERWLRADPRHAEAYGRLQRLWGASGHVPSIVRSLDPSVSRRKMLQSGALAAAGAAGLLGAGRLVLGPHPFADHVTGTGERRTVALSDGSVVDLSAATALDIRFDAGQRRVELLAGEAFFQVAPDRKRPFRVLAGGGSATALGTAFAVALGNEGARITVTEHAVLVRGQGDQVRVTEGHATTFGARGVGAVTPGEMGSLAWRDGRLAFVARPLGEVVAELNRWSRGTVIITNQELARRPVTLMIGTEAADEAMEQIAAVIPMRLLRLADRVTLVRAPN